MQAEAARLGLLHNTPHTLIGTVGKHLPKEIVGVPAPGGLTSVVVGSVTRPLAAIEEDYIRLVLQKCAGNKTQAAELLGISRLTLRNKLKDES